MLGPIPILLMDLRRRTSGTHALCPPACLPASLPACLPACLPVWSFTFLSLTSLFQFFPADHLIYSDISLSTMCLRSKWKERQIVTSFSFLKLYWALCWTRNPRYARPVLHPAVNEHAHCCHRAHTMLSTIGGPSLTIRS